MYETTAFPKQPRQRFRGRFIDKPKIYLLFYTFEKFFSGKTNGFCKNDCTNEYENEYENNNNNKNNNNNNTT